MDMLLEQFKVLFDRPEKVKKLRELILQLAVRGKLVEQDENDESAAVLLEKIKEEKERLVKEGKIKKEKPLPEIREDEKPYELPYGWEWVRLDGVSIKITDGEHIKPKITSSGIPLLTAKNVNDTFIDFYNIEYISEEDAVKSWARCNPEIEDILICSRGTIGRNTIIATKEKFCLMGTVILVKIPNQFMYSNYLNYYIKSEYAQNIMRNMCGSTAVNALYLKDVKKLIISVPPLEEQKRIVQKVDSLMLFCDNLVKELERKVKYSSLSSKSIFNSIGNPSSAEELEESLRFIIENFKDLTLGDGAIKVLKNAILQLAVQGKLVEQDPDDEPASVLLERLKEVKESLVREGKLKKETPLPEITECDKPYKLPEGWIWTRINDLSRAIEYGSSTKADLDSNKVPVLRMNNIYEGKIDFNNLKYVDNDIKDLPRLYLKNGDILFNRTNSYELVGKSAVYKGLDDKFTFASYLIRISIFNKIINTDYINYVMNSNMYRITQIEPFITQQNGQANYNGTKLKATLIPLPPYKEQNHIVEKIESLMKLCDELSKRIEKTKKYSEKLLESVLKETFKA